ncbi:ARF/SAR superfamily [Coniochaeta ligniaria NRRL 30616]|uniref:ARF/SAR superfamily n=1 Tax=Coniochaeta ligniaria NRRL 30616 TaxID=1408157 RepID=A0A1J7ITC7_9PEZI|nr:ARF/SAR superfamily [Coniochaeta ligniaria NRRL 30616]
MLAEDSIRAHEAAHHPDARKLIIGNTECTIFDLAGHQQARRSWRHYFRKVWGIVFVVDAADRARLPEARAEIDALLEVEGLTRVPLLVLGNKIDLPGAVSEEEFRTALGLYNPPFHMYEKGPIKVCMCSVIMQQGYGYGFNWLLKQVLGMHN